MIVVLIAKLLLIQKMRILFVIILHFSTVASLYEDQVGTFDWTQRYVGQVKFVDFDQSPSQGHKRILVTTESNVVAAINAKNGELGWRVILEKDSTGYIDDEISISNYFVTVTSGGRFVRAFNPTVGTLLWEKALTQSSKQSAKLDIYGIDQDKVAVLTESAVTLLELESGTVIWQKQLPNSETISYFHMKTIGENIVVVGIVNGSHISVIMLSEDRDEPILSQQNYPASWINKDTSCLFVGGSNIVCLDPRSLSLQILPLNDPTSFKSTSLIGLGLQCEQASLVTLRPYASVRDLDVGEFGVRLDENQMAVLTVSNGLAQLVKHFPGVSAIQLAYLGESKYILTLQRKQTNLVEFRVYALSNKEEITELRQPLTFPNHHGLPQQMFGLLYKRKDGSTGFRILVLSEDQSLVMFQQSEVTHGNIHGCGWHMEQGTTTKIRINFSNGRLSWTREEALAGVLSVEMVDLPLSPILAKIEEEFNTQGDDIFGMFIKRFSSQVSQLATLLHNLKTDLRMPRHHHHHSMQVEEVEVDVEDEVDEEGMEESALTRDEFNLHKLIIAVTSAGKIYGIDNLSGKHIWKEYLRDFVPFKKHGQESIALFVQRTTAHFDLEPLCTIIGQHKATGRGMLYSFNPISGAPAQVGSPHGQILNYNILQLTMISPMDDHFLRPILVMDRNMECHVYPPADTELLKELASSLFMYTLDADDGMLRGYGLGIEDEQIHGKLLWTVVTAKRGEKVTKVVAKRTIEHVHSQGIVLGDRSVKYKYLNPNLVAIVTEGTDNHDKAYINLYLIDGVSGQVINHSIHKKSKGPVEVVHSENWVVYSFWNQKHRRPEVAVIELYEGQYQTNASVFSSLNPPPLPQVFTQAYIFPGVISSMAATVTEKGITSKHILVALESGGILDLPKGLVDPRRPITNPEIREEGLMPYFPELPRPSEAIINYNQSVYNIRGIYSAPAGLESTSLVMCYGLDLFVTRVTPSKMFDVLKEDFDYFFIGSVVVGIIIVSFISQKLAARKALNRAWK